MQKKELNIEILLKTQKSQPKARVVYQINHFLYTCTKKTYGTVI